MSAENGLDRLETVAMCPDYEEYSIDLRKMMGRYILYEQLIMDQFIAQLVSQDTLLQFIPHSVPNHRGIRKLIG